MHWIDDGAWVLLIIGVVLTVFWLVQLLALMRMQGNEFPWEYDKALWFVAVFFGFALGALLFLIWRHGQRVEAEVQREVMANLSARRRNTPPGPADGEPS